MEPLRLMQLLIVCVRLKNEIIVNMKLNRLYFLLVVLLLGHTNLYAQVQESMYGDAVKADVKVDYVFRKP